MGELLGVVDVAALRPADRGSIETYLEVAFKHFGASNRRCTFRLIDTDHEGPLLDRLQHLGCREYLDAIRKQKGPSYVPGVASRMRALYTLSKSNALKVLLAAKESTGGCLQQHHAAPAAAQVVDTRSTSYQHAMNAALSTVQASPSYGMSAKPSAPTCCSSWGRAKKTMTQHRRASRCCCGCPRQQTRWQHSCSSTVQVSCWRIAAARVSVCTGG